MFQAMDTRSAASLQPAAPGVPAASPTSPTSGNPALSASSAPASHAVEPAYLSIERLSKRYRQHTVLEDLKLNVRQGEIISLLGPSGCGKTTLLRAIAGLIEVDAGSITLGGEELTRVPVHQRKVGVVFQNYALFPHLTVAQNIGLGLKAAGARAAAIEPVVGRLLKLMALDGYAGRSVAGLSGGQQQRVAVARALAVKPRMLLLDEPFSALDRKLRESMQVELRAILKGEGITAIFVTHDQEEAMNVSDRIAVMNAGRIEQFDRARDLYENPATHFVYDFIGQSTLVAGMVEARDAFGAVVVSTAYGTVQVMGNFRPGAKVWVGLRPEVMGTQPISGETNQFTCRIAHVSYAGPRCTVYCEAKAGDRLVFEALSSAMPGDTVGRETQLYWRKVAGRLFPRDDASELAA